MSRKKKQAEPFWQEIVDSYFTFCKNNLSEAPIFDGSAPRDLKLILKALRDRAESKGVEWTEKIALGMWNKFLEQSFKDPWLQKNFMLFQLNRQKQKIIFELANEKRNRHDLSYQEQLSQALQNYRPISDQ